MNWNDGPAVVVDGLFALLACALGLWEWMI